MKNDIAHISISRTLLILCLVFFFQMRKKINFYLSLKELIQLQRVHVGNNDGNFADGNIFTNCFNPQEVEKYPEVVGFNPHLLTTFW